MEIGNRLRSERKKLKLSQAALGMIGGVMTNAQGKYESGQRSPTAEYLARVAAIGVDVQFVVTGVRSPMLTLSCHLEASE